MATQMVIRPSKKKMLRQLRWVGLALNGMAGLILIVIPVNRVAIYPPCGNLSKDIHVSASLTKYLRIPF